MFTSMVGPRRLQEAGKNILAMMNVHATNRVTDLIRKNPTYTVHPHYLWSLLQVTSPFKLIRGWMTISAMQRTRLLCNDRGCNKQGSIGKCKTVGYGLNKNIMISLFTFVCCNFIIPRNHPPFQRVTQFIQYVSSSSEYCNYVINKSNVNFTNFMSQIMSLKRI